MYIVEKIGDLILITLENNISSEEINQIKGKLVKLASVSKEDVVVSIYYSDVDTKEAQKIEIEINKLLKYCNNLGLRVYSYQS